MYIKLYFGQIIYNKPAASPNSVDKLAEFVVDIEPLVAPLYFPLLDLTFVVEYFEYFGLKIIRFIEL